MARVLKGKYFPSSSSIEGKVPANVSFTWRSITSVRDVVGMGARRVIGDEVSTKIWDDPWVPKLHKFRVLPINDLDEDRPTMVNQLISNNY